MKYYLYNPRANNGRKPDVNGAELKDATRLDYKKFFGSLAEEDEVVLIGGDGTLNYLINHVDTDKLKNKISIIGNGSGNDFLNDINSSSGRETEVNKYLKGLPTVTVKGRTCRFINNMGFGIDGYVSEKADAERRKKRGKQINYTKIALKGLFYDFKPCSVLLEVDGRRYRFKDVWLAPTMKGRFYGGGMMIAPDQDRLSDHLTVVICTCRSRLRVLKMFPTIFKGEHIRNTKMIKVFTGKRIRVKFSRPCAAQIDGETVSSVTEYTAESAAR